MSKYWAIMKNDEFVVQTILNEGPDSQDEAQEVAIKWGMYNTDDKFTVAPLQQRSQAEQKSFHGRTEARGWK